MPIVVGTLVQQFGPAEVILFGSVAEGTDGPDSDLDFMIILDDAPRAERRDLMVQMQRATQACAAPADFLVTSVADYERRRRQVGTIEYETAHSGTVVYERQAA